MLCKIEDYICESSTASHYLFFLLFIVLHTPKSCCLMIIDLDIRQAISLIFDVWSTECGISKSWILYQRTIISIQQIWCIIEHRNLYIERGLWTPLTFPSIIVYASSFLPYFCYVLIWYVLLCSFYLLPPNCRQHVMMKPRNMKEPLLCSCLAAVKRFCFHNLLLVLCIK